MIELKPIIERFLNTLLDAFGDRVWFVGLQGSYSRGEATDSSDIDLVVILDSLSPADILTYRTMIDKLPHRDLLCGFLSGKTELLHWDAADLFHFYYDTTPIIGNLDEIAPLITDASVKQSVKTGICNIYHGCVHNLLYEISDEILRGLLKSASFVIQGLYFLKSGSYIRQKTALRISVSAEEQKILDAFSCSKDGITPNFQETSILLLNWAANEISKFE